jgi:hypothetical protein
MTAGTVSRRAACAFLPLFLALSACDDPAYTGPEAPDAAFAKSGGSHTPLAFAWSDGGTGPRVRSDNEGTYVDGEDVGSLPVRAYISVGAGRNAYMVTYHSARELCFEFPDTPVVQNLISTQEFPGLSFCAPSDMFLVNGTAFLGMQTMPSGASDPWNWATWPSLEVEFYPRGTTEVTYDLHFSSLRLIRTSASTWEAIDHENTQTMLSVVRRKSNKRLGVVDIPVAFTMMLK